MPYKMVGKKRVFVEDDIPQKTVQPVKAGLLAAPMPAPVASPSDPRAMKAVSAQDLFKTAPLGGDLRNSVFAQLGGFSDSNRGFDGTNPVWAEEQGTNEGGNVMYGTAPTAGALKSLDGYKFDWTQGDKTAGTLVGYDPSGKQVGSWNQAPEQSTLSSMAEWAALAAAGFGGVGLMGLGPLGGLLGGAGAAGGAAGGGGAGIGTGLAETAASLGTIGGEATAFGGLGELGALAAGAPMQTAFGTFGLEAGAGAAAAGGGLASAAEFGAGADLIPSVGEFGGVDAFGQSAMQPSLAGGIEPFVPQLPTIGAEATAFGGLPELSTLAASAPVETAFGSFGGGLLAPEVVAPSAFNPNALQSQNPLGGGLGPVAESVPSIAAETTAFGNLPELSALANGAAAATPLGSFALPAQAAPSGLLGTAKDAAAWMEKNKTLGRLLMGGATSLLSSSGSNSSGAPAAPAGPPVQWNSALQQGLLSPVQQYAPAAIQQQRPAGLLAQGYQNDGAWRYLKG